MPQIVTDVAWDNVLPRMPQIVTDFFFWLIWCMTSSSQHKHRRLWRLAVDPQPCSVSSVRQCFDKNHYPQSFSWHTLRVHDIVWRMSDAEASLCQQKEKHKKHKVADDIVRIRNFVFFLFFPLVGACCAQIKGFAPISGLWSKVFVKALPTTA